MFLIFVIIIIAGYIIDYCRRYYANVRRFPPGPRPIPVLGNLLQLKSENTHKQFEEFARVYGPVFTLFIPKPTVIITGLDEIREALIKKGMFYPSFLSVDADQFSSRPSNPSDSIFLNVPNGGIIFADGDAWREQKHFAHQTLRTFGMGQNLMEGKIHCSIASLVDHLNQSETKHCIDINWPIQLCLGNIIHEILFGYHFSHENCSKMLYFQHLIEDAMVKVRSRISVLLIESNPWMRHVPLIGWWGYGELRQVAVELLDFVGDEISKHKNEMDFHQEPTTFVAAYLQEIERRKKLQELHSFSIDNLMNVATDFWLAGMETAAATIRWGVLLLTAYPEVQAKMQDEIDETVGRTGRISMSHRHKMPYTCATIHEIQRVANVVTFNVFHKCGEDSEIAGLTIPKGTVILPQVTSVLSDPILFPDPERFDPDRFLDTTTSPPILRKDAIDNLIPFSIGRRSCAGEAIARVELFLVIATLVQNFDFSPADKANPPDLTPVFGILQEPRPFHWKISSRDK